MAFSMLNEERGFRPVAVCDACGGRATAGGFVVWEFDETLDENEPTPVLIACDEACVDAIADETFSEDAAIAATPIDAYLASLTDELAINVAAVLERERAAWAAEQTRNETPD